MRLITLAPCTLSLIAIVGLATAGIAMAAAASTTSIVPGSGHPNLPVTVAGTSFAANEAIDIYMDTTDTALVVATSAGAFNGSVRIPASAQPGKHTITAIGRHSGDAAQITFLVTTPWAEMGYGAAHLSWNPYENILNTSNVGSLSTLWQIPANGLGAAPIVSGGRVFLSTNTGLKAVSTTTGATLWTALPGNVIYASPALIGTTLFVADGGVAAMHALNAATGAVIWTQPTPNAFESSPVFAGGLVYAGSVDGKITAFSAVTGHIVWTFTTGAFIDSSPAIANGILYIGSNDNKLYALNAATGALIWSFTTGAQVESTPAVLNGVVYVGADDNKMYAINASGPAPGTLLWSYTAGGSIFAAPAVAYGLVYFGDSNGTMFAVNAHSGALQWSLPTGGVVESPVVANGVVYVTSRSNNLLALEAATGNILQTAVAGFSFLGNPTVSDGVLYLNAYNSDTYAFSLLGSANAIHAAARPPAPSSLHRNMSLQAVKQ